MIGRSSLTKKYVLLLVVALLLEAGISYRLLDGERELAIAIIACSVTTVVAFVVGAILAIGPVHSLSRQIKAIRFDMRSAPIELDRYDEIGDIAYEVNLIFDQLNELGVELDESRELVRKKVKSRTKELSEDVKRLRDHARTDVMTGLSNRRYFESYSKIVFDYAQRNETELACMMIDVDKFKEVNDTYGHAAGDDVIVLVGELIKQCTRQGDLCARYGGDEFVLLLHECGAAKANEVAERIRGHFRKEVVRVVGMTPVGCRPILPSLSIGVAMLEGGEVESVGDLMKHADDALYHVKESGRDAVCIYG